MLTAQRKRHDDRAPLAVTLSENWNYLVVITLMMSGLFIVISRFNLVKKLVGLSIFQTSVFLFYISVGKVAGGTAPIITGDPDTLYSNPLPCAILTAIVVGVATTAALRWCCGSTLPLARLRRMRCWR